MLECIGKVFSASKLFTCNAKQPFNQTMNLITYLTYCFLLLTISVNAQTIKLDFEPKGQVVKFYFDSLTIYTDTTSLFNVYSKYETKGLEAYDQRVKNLVLRQFKDSKKDTVFFTGNNIPFNDGIANKYEEDWYVEWAILHLTIEKNILIFDKHGQRVKAIKTKKIGTKKKNYIRRAYINKDNGEELFSETLFASGYTPAF